MPLSEHEQQLLAQMEQALVAEDPKFASQMQGRHHPERRRRQVLGGLGVLLGLGLVLGGVSLPSFLVGIVGFVVMVAGATYALTPPKVAAVFADPQSPRGRGPAAGRPGIVERMDERWERRENDW